MIIRALWPSNADTGLFLANAFEKPLGSPDTCCNPPEWKTNTQMGLNYFLSHAASIREHACISQKDQPGDWPQDILCFLHKTVTPGHLAKETWSKFKSHADASEKGSISLLTPRSYSSSESRSQQAAPGLGGAAHSTSCKQWNSNRSLTALKERAAGKATVTSKCHSILVMISKAGQLQRRSDWLYQKHP